jgi:hypothetical protein
MTRTGRPRRTETTSLFAFDSHQRGTQSGARAIASSMATNGATV